MDNFLKHHNTTYIHTQITEHMKCDNYPLTTHEREMVLQTLQQKI